MASTLDGFDLDPGTPAPTLTDLFSGAPTPGGDARNTPKSGNPDYWVCIACKSMNFEILADLPERFSYSVGSSYDAQGGMVAGNAREFLSRLPGIGRLAAVAPEVISKVVGGDLLFQPFTKLTWTGTGALEFTLELQFDAENYTKADVHDICNLLATLTLPGASKFSSKLLYPPNTTRISDINNALGGVDQRITVRIGRQYYFEDVVIKTAAVEIDQHLTDEGFPIAGTINLACSTNYSPSKQDLARFAGLGNTTGVGTFAANGITRDTTSPASLTPLQLQLRRG